jgi:DNA modification methylase
LTVTIRHGDCREVLRTLPAESVHCVVTSPPYWGLRDYGVAGQLGLETTLGEHLAVMVDVFEEVRRVLRKDGTLWLNYGDCYATTPNGRSAADTKAAGKDDRTFRDKPFSTIGGVLKPKDLCMIPNRLAIALQEAGWWVRSEIIWHKPNPMPENCNDRPTSSHEKIWLMSKSRRYFYDFEAAKEKTVSDHQSGNGFKREARLSYQNSFGEGRGNSMQWQVTEFRNPRNVWTLTTAAFGEAHFATFPPELAERCIKAGCPTGGVVLDPFGGAGTTGMVADRLGRDCILIELNPEYAAMAERRIKSDAGMFADVTG